MISATQIQNSRNQQADVDPLPQGVTIHSTNCGATPPYTPYTRYEKTTCQYELQWKPPCSSSEDVQKYSCIDDTVASSSLVCENKICRSVSCLRERESKRVCVCVYVCVLILTPGPILSWLCAFALCFAAGRNRSRRTLSIPPEVLYWQIALHVADDDSCNGASAKLYSFGSD